MSLYVPANLIPEALGPYSMAQVDHSLVWCSGQIPVNPETGEIQGTTIEEQTRQALTNLKNVLLSTGSDFPWVLKTTVFMTDLKEFDAFNRVYAEMFGTSRPARSCVQVAQLPKGAKIEIDAVAMRR